MKIKDLKGILLKIDAKFDETEITASIPVGCCGEIECLEDMDIDFFEGYRDKDATFHIHFSNKLEGHRSCIQRSKTLEEETETSILEAKKKLGW